MKLITGTNGFLGSAIKRSLDSKPEKAIFFTRKEFDLENGYVPPIVDGIETIIHCADYYPGLQYTSENPQEVYDRNVRIFENLFALARKNKIRRVVTIGTTGCYPLTDEPLREDMLLAKDTTNTNSKLIGYTRSRFSLFDIAKLNNRIEGIEHSHLILPNLYGPGDRFELGKSHLLSSWIRDFITLKEKNEPVTLWGSPEAKREFMYIDDSANYVLALSEQSLHREILNVGHGLTPTYGELARTVLYSIGHHPDEIISWDESKKNPRMREVMDLTEIERYSHLFPETTPFSEGVKRAVDFYQKTRKV